MPLNRSLVVDSLGISLDNFKLNVTKAVTRGKAAELAKEKKLDGTKDTRDKRNLYLAKEGLITPGSEAAQGLSKADLVKRQKAEAEKKAKLENPNNFVSTTRWVSFFDWLQCSEPASYSMFLLAYYGEYGLFRVLGVRYYGFSAYFHGFCFVCFYFVLLLLFILSRNAA